jgi:hypothetical protein
VVVRAKRPPVPLPATSGFGPLPASRQGLILFIFPHPRPPVDACPPMPQVVEGSAGVGIGCARELAAAFPGVWAGCTIVPVACGANVSLARLRALLAAHPAAE